VFCRLEIKKAEGKLKTAKDELKTAEGKLKTAKDELKTAKDELKTAEGKLKTAIISWRECQDGELKSILHEQVKAANEQVKAWGDRVSNILTLITSLEKVPQGKPTRL
jgi:multidrug resistance efflux pump